MNRLVVLALSGATLATLTPIAVGAKANKPIRNGRIAFSREIPGADDSAVYTINPSGSREKLVLSHAEGGAWAPDGRRLILFMHPDGPQRIVNVATGRYRNLPTNYPGGLFLGCGVWSPKGA